FESQSAFATDGRRLNFAAGIGLASQAVSWSAAAFQAQQALAAARQSYRRTLSPVPRGSWRSVVGFGAIGGEPPLSVNLGELERAMAHARTLHRTGLEATQLVPPMLEALRVGAPGPLSWMTSDWTDPQRRALAAVARDLAVGSADTPASEHASLWTVIIAALPWVTAVAPPASPRSRQGAEVTPAVVERSA
ncbi:MAG: hypothetical protein ACR2JY_12420, partial [Chloroflexota bacterium]